MSEHISSPAERTPIKGRRLLSSRFLILSALFSASAATDPCPPVLLNDDGGTVVSGAQACPTPTVGPSDTLNYVDPMASCAGLQGRHDVPVSSAAAFQQAISSAKCGDTIKLAPGSYSAPVSIDKECPMTAPVIIQGAANFESTVTAGFSVDGAQTTVTGINFSGPNAQIRVGGTNNKVLANKFTDWRQIAVTAESGKQVEIAYNDFSRPDTWENDSSSYPLRIGIRTAEKDPSNFHYDAWVHHNYFHDFPGKPASTQYHSGQSDAIEVCQSGRVSTALMRTGWYIESNLIERHMQGHGIIDLKCGGNVVRYNTVLDSPDGRIDARGGSYSVIESNWMENSGGSTIHGGHNKVIGNYVRGGQINVMAGDFEWNLAGGGHARAFQTYLAGNDSSSLAIGKVHRASSKFPALETVVEGHVGPKPVLGLQENTIIRPSTSVSFSAPFKLSPGRVGPAAMSGATASYLTCRAP